MLNVKIALLNKINVCKVLLFCEMVLQICHSSRGPSEADALTARFNYVYRGSYVWRPPRTDSA